ncbi:hypothetical protein LBMAG42_48820 [Deltaproteobacteria bacterium]|nr:hypothetical protein LBMAG42_48820 [Deltaproteobacteria bacterium]
MQDGPLRILVKTLVRWALTAEMALRRRWLNLRGEPRWELTGTCGSCARCCDAPTLQTGVLTARLPTLRRIFLAWHRVVNGWDLVRMDRSSRLFVFRCTHLHPATRQCDSYASRPLACRDYPRGLLFQPWPELFDECGFRALARDRDARMKALRDSGLTPEELAIVARRLRLR